MRNDFLSSLTTYPWLHAFLSLAPLGLTLTFLAAEIGTHNELPLHFTVVRAQNPKLTTAVNIFTDTASFGLYILYAALFWQGLRKKEGSRVKRVLIFALVQIGIAAILVQCIKVIAGSPRPMHALTHPSNIPFSFKAAHHSFPSGHTTEIVNASSTLAVWFRRPAFSLAMGILIALMGYSRIYLSQHHLIDIIAGMALGFLANLLIHFFCSREYHYEYPFRQISRWLLRNRVRSGE